MSKVVSYGRYGWVMLIVLSVMGRIIAYLSDKIGSRVETEN